MAGLNDLVTNKEIQATTLPSWYSTAQQNLVNQSTGVTSPALADTAAQSAVSSFGAGSPFTAGQNILQSIGSGAANPWLVSTDATGAQTVSPNVATPLGGLFAAQKDYLGTMMPTIEAQRTAQSIAGGDFGSRMNLSGLAAERNKAFSDLAQKQMQAALQAQQYGVAAGAGLGNIGQEQVKSALETGKFQQNAPYAGALNLANILQTVKPEQTQTTSRELGGLNQIMGLLSATQGGLSSLMGGIPLKDASGKVILDAAGKPVLSPGVLDQASQLWKKLLGTETNPTAGPNISGWQQAGDTGYWYDPATGFIQDPTGTVYRDNEIVYDPYGDISLDNYYQDSESTEL